MLRDFANILPSHAADIKLAANDVPGNYAKLVDAVVKAKGQIRTAKLNEQDKLNITAQLDFTVPIADKPAIDKLLGEIGTMLSRNNVQAPLNELTTERKFGYAIVLRDFAAIPPRKTFHLILAAADVPASFHELQDAVAAAKGLVTVGQLTEDSKVKIEARFEFDIPSQERQGIEKLFNKVGAVLGRTSSQVPVNDLATDQKVGYRLTIRSTAAIPPRDTTALKIEVKDVDARAADLKAIVLAGKGRVIDSNIERHENGQVIGVLKFEVPFASEDTLLSQIKSAGTVVSQQAKRNPQVPENELTTAHIFVTLAGTTPIVPSDEGLAPYIAHQPLHELQGFLGVRDVDHPRHRRRVAVGTGDLDRVQGVFAVDGEPRRPIADERKPAECGDGARINRRAGSVSDGCIEENPSLTRPARGGHRSAVAPMPTPPPSS